MTVLLVSSPRIISAERDDENINSIEPRLKRVAGSAKPRNGVFAFVCRFGITLVFCTGKKLITLYGKQKHRPE
jgi:hypothetical protein